jgi:anion-transporting  ArsA/GET3 family ATPase
MISEALKTKRCLMVCGGGGVGKTTVAASLGVAATKYRKRVLVVTIDPSKRLAEAFGFTENALLTGGEPLKLSPEVKKALGVADDADLSVGILNPKYVLDQILDQVLTSEQRERLRKTVLYAQMSQMIYGLQEYTAYEWVTRMLREETYDFVVLDTPPAFHAKDFFNVPDKVKNLMESRVFQLFTPKKKTWLGSVLGSGLSFGFLEKLLGEKIYNESRTFFEVFTVMRERILERCEWLARFFTQSEVAVVAVATPESSAQFELEGLVEFMKQKRIPLQGIIVNQVEVAPEPIDFIESELNALNPDLMPKLNQLRLHQQQKAELAAQVVARCRAQYPSLDLQTLPMNYSSDGFEILRAGADQLKELKSSDSSHL